MKLSFFFQQYRSILLFFSFLLVHEVFLMLIYQYVGWSLSVFTLSISILAATSLWFIFSLFPQPYRTILAAIIYSAIGMYLLGNVLYIPVFNSFIPLGFSLETQTIFPTIKEFLPTLSLEAYLSSALFIFFSVFLLYETRHQSSAMHRALYGGTAFAAFICLISYSIAHPNPNWWQMQYKQQALGPYGTLMESAIQQVLYSMSEPTFAAQEDIQNAIFSPTTTPNNDPVEISQNVTANIDKKHIIFYQMESVPQWALEYGIEAMPFLQQLMKDYISVDGFYPNGCHTIDAELTTLCSQYSHPKQPVARVGTENNYSCLPHILQQRYGYTSISVHADNTDFWARDVLHPKWGIEELRFTPEFRLRLPDDDLLQEVVSILKQQEQPSIIDVIGFSSHAPHTFATMKEYKETFGHDISLYEGPLPADLVERIELETETDVRAYLGFMQSIDTAIKHFVQTLKEEELFNDTIIVITGDHRYYNFTGQNEKNFYDYNRVPLVIIAPDGPQRTQTQIASHIDVAPTVLSLLEKDHYQAPKEFVGTSIFDPAHPQEAFFSCHGDLYYSYKDKLIIQSSQGSPSHYILKNQSSILQKQVDQIVTSIQNKAIFIEQGFKN